MDTIDSNTPDLHSEELLLQSTFFPDEGPEKFDLLLEKVSQKRYANFLVVYVELYHLFADVSRHDIFFDNVVNIMVLPEPEQRVIVNDPVFRIWMALAFRETNAVLTGLTTETASLEKMLDEFSAMLQRIEVSNAGQRRDENLPVRRFDVDPLIMRATPPSYEFPKDESVIKQLEKSGYSVHFFRDVVKIALDRMALTWPECHEQFKKLVKLVCYFPDGSFRSCSASRYTGVILISARDNSILELEESLVHEGAHQLLYNIVEAYPVIVEQASQDRLYKLPWSGQQRDLYGYFHAFFVYIFIFKYLERIKKRPESELHCAQNRMIFILRGLTQALPDFHANTDFSYHGRLLFENLAREVRNLEVKYTHLLAVPVVVESIS